MLVAGLLLGFPSKPIPLAIGCHPLKLDVVCYPVVVRLISVVCKLSLDCDLLISVDVGFYRLMSVFIGYFRLLSSPVVFRSPVVVG